MRPEVQVRHEVPKLSLLVWKHKFCNDALMLLNMSSLPLTVSSISVRSCCITSDISCLNGWNVTISAVVTIVSFTILLLLELLLLPRDSKDFRTFPHVVSLNDAPLLCQMQVCFVASLSQRECVGASGTKASDKCAVCNGECTYKLTLSFS